jgi:hypothetical protein
MELARRRRRRIHRRRRFSSAAFVARVKKKTAPTLGGMGTGTLAVWGRGPSIAATPLRGSSIVPLRVIRDVVPVHLAPPLGRVGTFHRVIVVVRQNTFD